jgi:DNA-binding winged helix-turn-helix (wHTH) protein/TolB-like protein/Flp pilus assembly protein TadD
MKSPESNIYRFAGFTVDAQRRLVTGAEGESVAITGRVFDVLLFLVRNPDRLITKRELMEAVWNDTIVEENNLTQTISTLRRALGEKPDEHRFVVTVPARGYRFIAGVNDDAETAAAPARTAPPGSRAPSRRAALAIAAVFLLAVVAGASWRYFFPAIQSPGIKSIAVLPFRPLVPEAHDASLELGMADTLILRLSNGRELVVRPLSSVRKYVGSELDAMAAGRELGVDAVIDGSISRSGNAVRVTARLVRVSDGAAIWGGQFDETWSNVFTVQDNIAEQVASALALRLTQAQRLRLTRRDTVDDEAYRLYLLGRYHWSRLIPPELHKSIEYFQQALLRDPNYAIAYAGLAESYRALAISADAQPTEVLPQAKAAALKALAIDPDLQEARASLCFINIWSDWDWPEAERQCKQALESKPNSSEAHRAYSILLSDLGRGDDAIREARRARELDPLSLVTNALEAHVLLYAGHTAEALQRTEQTLALDPNFWIAWLFRGKALLAQGDLPQALVAFGKSREFSHENSEAVSLVGYTLAISGDREGALRILQQLNARAAQQYVPPFNIAMIYNGLGQNKDTLDMLERAYLDRDVRLTFLRVEHKWDPLRTDPRFVSLAQRMKLE